MRCKLKECQGIWVQAYKHLDEYIEGDLVWYQPLNGNSWLGPAAVLCQSGQSVWINSAGDIKIVASCRTKPFQLVDRDEKRVSTKVMLEEGLEDIENIVNLENEDKEELKEDNTQAKYLKMVSPISFSELCNFTVELPVSKHNTPEVKAAKMNEIRNLKGYDTFEEVPNEGQETIGSHWVITEKEKHDGQKQQCKARLVKGFQ